MRIVRRAAQKISAIVLQYASVGCKEWAEGLAREVDFIESDWRALLWSLGSLRVLLDRRWASLRSLDDLSPLAKKFTEEILYAKLFAVVSIVNVGATCLTFSNSGSPSKRASCGMIAVAWAALGTQSLLEMRAKQKLANKDQTDLVRYYRSELKRQVIFGSPKQWIGICTLLFFVSSAFMTVFPFLAREYVYCSVPLLLVPIVIDIYTRRNAHRRLQELDALLETGS